MKKYIPERGDIAYVDFNPVKGHEQSGRRPAIVISNSSYNKLTSECAVLPITSKIKNYSFEVSLGKSHKTTGVILSDQIRNVSWEKRNVDFIEKVRIEVLDEAVAKVISLISS